MSGYRPIVLLVLDGWGISKNQHGNAAMKAHMPNIDRYFQEYPHTSLVVSGEAVGLPVGQMGNSEVGHLNIGAGRIVYQDLTRISRAIEDGSFFENTVLKRAYATCRKDASSALHLMGLLSDGGVHSHFEHIIALVEMAKKMQIENVYLHVFLDGRDVDPKSALLYIKKLEVRLGQIGLGQIVTVSGRYYAMDRDNRWERVEKAYRAMVLAKGREATTAEEAVRQAYAEGINDEFVLPTVILQNGKPIAKIRDGDTVIFFNFRGDRARQLTRAFVDKQFDKFARQGGFMSVNYVCMTEYDATIDVPVVFAPERLKNTLGEVLAKEGMRQLRIAETEKYAHVTFFFNGGVEKENIGEDRILIPSARVATYDLQPEMSAYEVTDVVVDKLRKDTYDVVIVNYANPDMVGHTGNFDAAVRALEVVDECVGNVVSAVLEKNGVILITSDHGNVEEMFQEQGTPQTAHTANSVPLIAIGLEKGRMLVDGGSLRDLAPTILQLLSVEIPAEMTGKSLLGK